MLFPELPPTLFRRCSRLVARDDEVDELTRDEVGVSNGCSDTSWVSVAGPPCPTQARFLFAVCPLEDEDSKRGNISTLLDRSLTYQMD